VRVSVENGSLRSCFVDAGFRLEWASGDSVYRKAKSTTVAVKALGLATESGEALSGEYVDVVLERNGESIPMKFDSTTNRFTAQLNAPFEADEVVRAEATLSLVDRNLVNASAQPIERTLTVVETPPPPSAEWIGDRQIEGAGELRGEAQLSTDFDVDGESKVCVTFEPKSPVTDATGEVIGNATIDSGPQCSAPGAETLTFDVVVDFPQAQNADGTMELVYSATFQDAGLEPEVIDIPSPLMVKLSQTKPAKTGAGVLFASLLALAVAAVSYLLLFLAARFQGKLQDPARLLIAEADVRTETVSGARSRLQGVGRFQASDLKRVTQDGSGYAVGPLTIKRTWPFNPLAEIHAVLACKDGTVMCDPSMTKTAKPGRRAAIPTRFDELVAAHVHDGQARLYVLMRAGATGDDFQRAMDLSLSRLEQRIRAALLESERSDRQLSPSRATTSAVTADETSTVSSEPGAGASPDAAPPRPPRPPMPPSRSQER
jgi:hypothetical protein